jgi:adenosylcobyric acid synthase
VAGVDVRFLHPGQAIPGNASLVIIPGSKSTIADLAALKAAGWDIDLKAHNRRGGAILGLCGGYQMLGRAVHDPQGLEGSAGSVEGLGLLDVETSLLPEKSTRLTQAVHVASAQQIQGYEIHLGETLGPDCTRPFAMVGGNPEGATSKDGLVQGTYLHGCFTADGFRQDFLKALSIAPSGLAYEQGIEDALDALAGHLEQHLNLDRILALAEEVQ